MNNLIILINLLLDVSIMKFKLFYFFIIYRVRIFFHLVLMDVSNINKELLIVFLKRITVQFHLDLVCEGGFRKA